VLHSVTHHATCRPGVCSWWLLWDKVLPLMTTEAHEPKLNYIRSAFVTTVKPVLCTSGVIKYAYNNVTYLGFPRIRDDNCHLTMKTRRFHSNATMKTQLHP
jgi:hypothetical protein